MKFPTRLLLAMIALATGALSAHAAGALEKTECVAPAKPGGGFDLTCKLVQSALVEGKFIADPMRVTYMPGGIGAVAYNTVIAQRPDSANTIIAFSGGSLLNLAQGKFGRYTENDVRWLSAIGTDYGAVVVAESSPFKSLKDVMAAMKAEPTKVVLGAGGTVGSQDWMKAALTARAGGVNPKSMRYVGAKVRILAVMHDKRLSGDMANIPTAAEQGFDVQWPIIRGFYLGPKVSDADYKVWADTFTKMMATPAYNALRTERGLFPLAMTGAELDAYVKKQVAGYRKLADEFGLATTPAK